MLKIRLALSLSSLMLLHTITYAQAKLNVLSDTLRWKAESYKDVVTDTTAGNTSEFVTYGSSKIIWTQTGAEQPTVFEFNVLSAEDHWETGGYFVLNTIRKTINQTFKFERIGATTRVTLTYSTHEGPRTLIFSIDEISPITN